MIISRCASASWALASLATLLVACGRTEEEALQEWVRVARLAVPATVLGQMAAADVGVPRRSYQAVDLPDPFSPQKIPPLLSETRSPAEAGRSREPLEAFALDAIKLVGVMSRNGLRVALLMAGNQVHPIWIGEHVGQNQGQVQAISENEIVLRERSLREDGQWVSRTVALRIGDK